MKKLPVLLLLASGLTATAASDTLHLPGTEMDIYNGLMYAPADMRELKKTADSLGVAFRQCPAPETFVSWPQASATGFCFIMKDGTAGPLIDALENGVSIDSIKKQFGQWMKEASMAGLVVYNPLGKKDRAFYAGNAGEFNNFYTNEGKYNTWRQHKKGGWVYQESGDYESAWPFRRHSRVATAGAFSYYRHACFVRANG